MPRSRVQHAAHRRDSDHPRRDLPVLAAVRLAASQDAGYGIPQAAREALDFVIDRRKPNALT